MPVKRKSTKRTNRSKIHKRKHITRRKSNRRRYFGGSPKRGTKRKFNPNMYPDNESEKKSKKSRGHKYVFCPFCVARGLPRDYAEYDITNSPEYMDSRQNGSKYYLHFLAEKREEEEGQKELRHTFWQDPTNGDLLKELNDKLDGTGIDRLAFDYNMYNFLKYE
jgi:hypothetical protein